MGAKSTMEIARDAWWSDLALRGDPGRRPNLTWEAFEAGYKAAAVAGDTLPELHRRISALEAVAHPPIDLGEVIDAAGLAAQLKRIADAMGARA